MNEAESLIKQGMAKINVAKGNKGTIELEFFSKEDLQSILEALAR